MKTFQKMKMLTMPGQNLVWHPNPNIDEKRLTMDNPLSMESAMVDRYRWGPTRRPVILAIRTIITTMSTTITRGAIQVLVLARSNRHYQPRQRPKDHPPMAPRRTRVHPMRQNKIEFEVPITTGVITMEKPLTRGDYQSLRKITWPWRPIVVRLVHPSSNLMNLPISLKRNTKRLDHPRKVILRIGCWKHPNPKLNPRKNSLPLVHDGARNLPPVQPLYSTRMPLIPSRGPNETFKEKNGSVWPIRNGAIAMGKNLKNPDYPPFPETLWPWNSFA